MKKLFLIATLLTCSVSYGQSNNSDENALSDEGDGKFFEYTLFKTPNVIISERGKAQYKNEQAFVIACNDAEDTRIIYYLFSKKGYTAYIDKNNMQLNFPHKNGYFKVRFNQDQISTVGTQVIFGEEVNTTFTINTETMTAISKIKYYDGELIEGTHECFHAPFYWLNMSSLDDTSTAIFNEFTQFVKDSEEQKRYDKIYNACLLDKAQGMSMEVDSVRDAVEGACESIAKDPSWLENWKYN